jgi:hypothetical protein
MKSVAAMKPGLETWPDGRCYPQDPPPLPVEVWVVWEAGPEPPREPDLPPHAARTLPATIAARNIGANHNAVLRMMHPPSSWLLSKVYGESLCPDWMHTVE